MYHVFKTQQPAATSLEEIDVFTQYPEPSLESLEFVTNLMVKNQTPHAPTIVTNLQILDQHLPKDVIRTYAQNTIKAASRLIDEQGGCAKCILDKKAPNNSSVLSRKASSIDEIANAIVELIEIAAN